MLRFAHKLAVALALGAVAAACGATSVAPTPTPTAGPPAPDPAPPPRDDGRLPGGVVPTGYQLQLTVDPEQPTFLGRARISVEITKPTYAIVLHGRDFEVLTAAVIDAAGKQWAQARLRAAAHGKQGPEELVLVTERELVAGPASLDIQYEAPFAAGLRGLYRVKQGEDSYAFTQFEPSDARRAFPCFDEPGYKVPFELVLTVPTGYQAFANTPLRRSVDQPQSQMTSHEFEKSPPLPTYLVAMAVGPLDVLDGDADPVPMRVIAARGKAELGKLALTTAPKQLAALADYFDEPYPYAKLDLVAVPDFGAGAMENAGIVTFREELLLLDPGQASVRARRGLVGVMAHELAHQWFGNLVTMSWWNDIWLNEAFATWMGTKIVDQLHPEFSAGVDAVARKSWVMGVDALGSARKIRQPVRSTSEALESFDGITYVKGMAVLGMVEAWLGEDAFREGIRAYIRAHRWKNAEAEDLFAALGRAGKGDVSKVMDSFVDQTGVPQVEVSLDCGGAAPGAEAKPKLRLAQREYRPLGAERKQSKSWRFPVCVRYLVGKKSQTVCGVLAEQSLELPLEADRCPTMVYPNASEAGYYRFSMDEAGLSELGKHASAELTERERVGLVGNALALVSSGDASPGALLSLFEQLRGEPSRVVWQQIVEALERVDQALVTEQTRAAFARYVAKLLGPRARRLGWKPHPDETADTRLERRALLLALGSMGQDAWARRGASEQAKRWLADPSSVDADVAAVAVALYAAEGDEALYQALVERLRDAATPEQRLIALGGLTGLTDPVLVRRVLALGLDGTILAQDLRYVFPALFGRRETRQVAYDWTRESFDQLEKQLPSFVAGRTVWVMANLCDEAKIRKAEQFFTPRVRDIEGAEKHLEQAVEAGRLCAALAEKQRPALRRWLGGPN